MNGRRAFLLMALFSLPALAGSPEMIATDYFGDDDEPSQHALTLQTVAIEVELSPGYASTTMELKFLNPTNFEVAGDLTLEMPYGSIVTGYGLDIDGVIRDGVIIEQSVATEIIHESIREGIDPGLGETTRDHAFHTRVFPVPAEASRTIRVSFVSPIGESRPYVLPLSSDTKIEFLEIEIRARGKRPKVRAPKKLRLRWQGDSLPIGTASAKNIALDRELRIEPLSQEGLVIERWNNHERFLAAALPVVDLDDRRDAQSLRVFWDTSMSHAGSASDERRFLTKLMKRWNDADVEFVFFDSNVNLVTGVENAQRELDVMFYHGGTDLEALFAAQESVESRDSCVLFSDGRKTLGGFPKTELPCRLDVITAAPDADRATLKELARRNGGRFVDLTDVSTEAALEALDSPVRDVQIEIDGVDVAQKAVWSDDGVLLRLVIPVAEDARNGRVLLDGQWLNIDVSELTVRSSDTYAPVWASSMISRERAEGTRRADLVAMSRAYEVEIAETAFIVLEEPRDYVENEIDLPDSGFSKEDRTEYAILVAERAEEGALKGEARSEFLGDAWRGLGDWYENPRPAAQESSAERAASRRPENRSSPARREQSDGIAGYISLGEERIEEIVTTGSRIVNGSQSGAARGSQVHLENWTPEREYLEAVKGLCEREFWLTYRERQQTYGELPAFYLEMFDHATSCEDEQAASIALSALELPFADSGTMTAVAMRLSSHGLYDAAIDILRQAVYASPRTLAIRRNLAAALSEAALSGDRVNAEKIAALQEALELLVEVSLESHDGSGEGIELVTLLEANRVLEALRAFGGDSDVLPSELQSEMQMDVRVVLSWNSYADIDLWVTEPGGERVGYSNRRSRSGGFMTNDVVDRFGPEQYLLRSAQPGKYGLAVDYFEADRLNPNGAVVVRVDVYRNWGREMETRQTTWVELRSDSEDDYPVGTITVH